MNKIKIPMNSKPNRPKIQNIFMLSIINGDPVLEEKFIIVAENGEVLNTPIFLNRKDAEDWLDEHYPKQNYDLN